MIENNFQNFDFNQQQFLIIQRMIQKIVVDVIDVAVDFFDFSKSSKSQNTSTLLSDNLFVDR